VNLKDSSILLFFPAVSNLKRNMEKIDLILSLAGNQSFNIVEALVHEAVCFSLEKPFALVLFAITVFHFLHTCKNGIPSGYT